MRDTAPPPNRAAILLPWDKSLARLSAASRSAEARLAEAVGLAASIGLVVVHQDIFQLRHVTPATLLGKGQMERAAEAITAAEVSVVVVDAMLTPVQQRNLETAWKAKVIDRTGLILDIRRPRPHPGGHAAGRARASGIPALAAGALLDPFGAPARRLRLPGRPR